MIRNKIIIVEDDPGISKYLQAALRGHDYEPMLATDGKTALEMIASHCPDLVLLDLGLPDMDGSEIIRSVRSWSRMPIIVISARSAELDKAAALDMGADDYLTKPFGTVELLARIRTALRRRGKANIKEQVGILRRAAAENAQVLVIECMALQPEYQRCAQHRILQADVGVITNVRHDHADVMGATLPEIADTLCNTVPQNGILFTADEAMAPRLQAYAEKMHSRFTLARPNGSEPDFDFAENIALALAVCQQLGVARQTALQGMAHYKRDPYALALYTAGNGIFVNAVSVNDPDSTYIVWQQLQAKLGAKAGRLVLIVCNRADRGSRTRDMLTVCTRLAPAEIWLAGSHKNYMKARLHRLLPGCCVRSFAHAAQMPLGQTPRGTVLLAVGNLYGAGRELIARAREEGSEYV